MPTTQRALLRRVAVEQRENRIPSLIAAVVRDGEVSWLGARGFVGGAPPTADTQYRIGSITKTFVAVLVMRLRDEGRLDLSDKLDDHLPGTAAGRWSIAELLSHSTGLRAESEGQWWERTEGAGINEFLATVGEQSVRKPPRHVFHYSNIGFALLGELVARARGMSWFDAVRTEILEPLGMSRTTTAPVEPHATGLAVHPWADVVQTEPAEDAGGMAPAGQLWSTVDDMARWLRFLCGDTASVLHPDTLAEMRSPGSVDDGPEWKSGSGLGLQLVRHKGRRLAGHGGSMPGFLSTVFADPAEHLGTVFLANSTTGVNSTLLLDMFDLLQEHEPPIPEPWQPSGDVTPDLLELTGTWYWGPMPYVLRIRPEGLLDLAPIKGKGRASRFRANPDGTFTGLDGYYAGEVLTVGRASDGSPEYLDLNTFIFTRAPYEPASPVPGQVTGWRSRP